MVITSRNNPLVRRVFSLREKKFRREAGEYVAEGIKSVREAAASGAHIRLLVRAERVPAQDIAADGELVVSDGVFEKLSEEVSPQGVLAVIETPDCTPAPPRSLALLLDGVSDPGNMGTVLRTADAAGYTDVYLRGCTDPFAPKSVRASMGGIFRVRLHIGGDEALRAALAGVPLVCADMGGERLSLHPARAVLPGRRQRGERRHGRGARGVRAYRPRPHAVRLREPERGRLGGHPHVSFARGAFPRRTIRQEESVIRRNNDNVRAQQMA